MLLNKNKKILKSFKSSEDAFTLIEVLIAVAIFGLTSVGYLGANTSVFKLAELSFEKTLAVKDAQRVSEQIRNDVKGLSLEDIVIAYPDGSTVSGYNSLTSQQVTINYINIGTKLLDIRIDVSWSGYSGRDSSVSLRSMIAKRG